MSTDLAIPGVSEIGLSIPADLPYDEWRELGQHLGRIGRAWQWYIGDWLNYGERVYGEKYAQAIEATGYDYDTLNGFRWVAKNVELVRRRTSLSFSHHQEVAALNPADQDRWLTSAEANGWSKGKLRSELKKTREVPAERERCPTCGHPLPASVQATNEEVTNAHAV